MSSDLHEYREFPKHDPRKLPPHYPNRQMDKDEVKEKYAATNKRFYSKRMEERNELLQRMEEKRKAKEEALVKLSQTKFETQKEGAEGKATSLQELATPRFIKEPFDPEKYKNPPPPLTEEEKARFNPSPHLLELAKPVHARKPFKPVEFDRTKHQQKLPPLSKRLEEISERLHKNKSKVDK